MKKIICIVILILIFTLPAWGEETGPRITVYGMAEAKVTPDEMVWTLKITNRGPAVDALAEAHSIVVQNALSFIKEAGVPEDETRTSMMQYGENWGHQSGRRVQEGYVASSRITFKLTDFSKYRHLWTGLSKIRDMSIQNIGYGYSKHREAGDKARADALRAAREKARAMAAVLDVGLGHPVVIEDDPSFAAPMRSNMMMASEAGYRGGSQDSGGFALGKILIKSRVKVVYRLKVPE